MHTGLALPGAVDSALGAAHDDATVVQHACADPAAFEVLYVRYRDRLYWAWNKRRYGIAYSGPFHSLFNSPPSSPAAVGMRWNGAFHFHSIAK
jgi:hypothetical protein